MQQKYESDVREALGDLIYSVGVYGDRFQCMQFVEKGKHWKKAVKDFANNIEQALSDAGFQCQLYEAMYRARKMAISFEVRR